MNLSGKNVLVVGASEGIGAACALEFARRGCTVGISARRQSKLNVVKKQLEAEGARAFTFMADATKESEAKKTIRRAVKEMNGVDIALLNVGGGKPLLIENGTAGEAIDCMQFNYDSMIYHFFPLVEHMRERGGGIIAHTNSLAGFTGLPISSHYSAAKAASRLFLDGARVELKKFGIYTVTLCPGFVETKVHDSHNMSLPFMMTPEKTAKKMVTSIARKRRVNMFPWTLAFGTWFGNVLPKWILEPVLRMGMPKGKA